MQSLSALDPWPDSFQWRPVSSRLIAAELTERAIWLVVLLGGSAIAWLFTQSWWAVAVGAAVLVLNIIGAIFGTLAVRSYGYAERDRDLLVRHGRMIRRLSIVPYARMQFVDVTAGPLERMFNIATVRLHTAAAASDAFIPGLRPDEATRLRDRLAALGEDRGEGL
ncbi:membrane protein [Rhizocola hellebori]|uniref:Membrane protein n=1 Tax=Rhizocola hellebori TaxID=1392758 RepID=A0A8J3QC66_9ACTN|nr:PH domain-containing protein [Rhizocola hellebori]GIH07262.1 membrane protein [Rhizocola hellebori]